MIQITKLSSYKQNRSLKQKIVSEIKYNSKLLLYIVDENSLCSESFHFKACGVYKIQSILYQRFKCFIMSIYRNVHHKDKRFLSCIVYRADMNDTKVTFVTDGIFD